MTVLWQAPESGIALARLCNRQTIHNEKVVYIAVNLHNSLGSIAIIVPVVYVLTNNVESNLLARERHKVYFQSDVPLNDERSGGRKGERQEDVRCRDGGRDTWSRTAWFQFTGARYAKSASGCSCEITDAYVYSAANSATRPADIYLSLLIKN